MTLDLLGKRDVRLTDELGHLDLLYRELASFDFEIIAVMRRERVLLPHGQTLLEPDDRVIVITAGRPGAARQVHRLPGVAGRRCGQIFVRALRIRL